MTAGRKNESTDKEWYTPQVFLDSVVEVFGGGIDLDPCWSPDSLVVAGRVVDGRYEDGLLLDWSDYGRIYCNPPYGRDESRGTTIKSWIRKCSGAGSEVIALVPVATNTTHWKQYVFPTACCVCFVSSSRFKFLGAGSKGAPMAVAAVYWGSKYASAFEEVFGRDWGAVMTCVRRGPVAPPGAVG
jgi:hypothetical protein